jgi:hypothetical protein
MAVPRDRWLSRTEGPVVRPYALTGGRTRPTGEAVTLLALVQATENPLADAMFLEPEFAGVLRRCGQPTPVADLAADLDLPDMRERGLISIRPPSASPLTDARILKDVADALRRL